MKKLFGLTALLTSLFLVACEADPAFVGQPTPPVNGGTSPQFFMGSGSDITFEEGVIDITDADIPALGITDLNVSIVDINFEPVPDPITVTFTSVCTGAGTAMIDPTPTDTVGGFASTTYTDIACPNEDTITATATFSGENLEATGVITITP